MYIVILIDCLMWKSLWSEIPTPTPELTSMHAPCPTGASEGVSTAIVHVVAAHLRRSCVGVNIMDPVDPVHAEGSKRTEARAPFDTMPERPDEPGHPQRVGV